MGLIMIIIWIASMFTAFILSLIYPEDLRIDIAFWAFVILVNLERLHLRRDNGGLI